MSRRNQRDAKAGRRDSDGIRGWLADVREQKPDEEADQCQWPGCGGPMDVMIWAEGTAGGRLIVRGDSVELEGYSRPGAACGVHAEVILSRLPGDQIDRVAVYSDPDDPEQCDPAEAAGIRAVLRAATEE